MWHTPKLFTAILCQWPMAKYWRRRGKKSNDVMSSAHCLHSNMHCMLCWVLTIHCFQVERLSASILNILEAGCMHSSVMQLMFYFYSPENFGPVSRLDLRRNGQMGDITAFLCCCPTAQATWCLGVIGSPLSGWRVKFSPSTPGFTQNITTGALPFGSLWNVRRFSWGPVLCSGCDTSKDSVFESPFDDRGAS